VNGFENIGESSPNGVVAFATLDSVPSAAVMSLSLQNCWSNRNWLIGRPTQDSVSLAELALEPGNFGGALLQSVAEVGLWIRRLRRSFNLSILPISLNESTYDKPPFRMVSAQVRWTASGPVLRRSILTAEAATKGSESTYALFATCRTPGSACS
jgi:hypothetical protein